MDLETRRTASNHHHYHLIAPFGRSFSENRNYGASVTLGAVKPRSKMQTFLTNLRRKLRKEKNKVFSCGAPPRHDTYDPCTYSQNFDDQESRWEEPDNLSRSFSARFAATSSRMVKKSGMGLDLS